MISACIVDIVNRLSITHNQLSPWKAPATILNQVSWSKTKSNQVKCKLNLNFYNATKVVWYILPIYEIVEVFEISVRWYIVSQILHRIISLRVLCLREVILYPHQRTLLRILDHWNEFCCEKPVCSILYATYCKRKNLRYLRLFEQKYKKF